MTREELFSIMEVAGNNVISAHLVLFGVNYKLNSYTELKLLACQIETARRLVQGNYTPEAIEAREIADALERLAKKDIISKRDGMANNLLIWLNRFDCDCDLGNKRFMNVRKTMDKYADKSLYYWTLKIEEAAMKD